MVLWVKPKTNPDRQRSVHIRLIGFTNSLPVSLGHRALPLINHHRSQELRPQRRPFEFGAYGDPQRRSTANPRRATAGLKGPFFDYFLWAFQRK
jgi:hypothetical protein